MDKMRIRGGKALFGTVAISGAKNAALPILISSLLTDQCCRYRRVPNLQDTRTTLKLLRSMGVTTGELSDQGVVELQAGKLTSTEAVYDLVKTMRASVWVLGPLVARWGTATVSLPGGCAIGARPINFHLTGLEKLGAKIELANGNVMATAKKLKGAKVVFEFPSVGATANLLMAATLADGETRLENCAREPEIVDLARVLRSMGAVIEGEGTETILVQGQTELRGCDYEIMGDRIEAGTFLAAAFATHGEVRIEGLDAVCLASVLAKFEEAGATVTSGPNWIALRATERARGTDVTTLPFPGFPTDMQAQFMAVMATAEGTSIITETVFENRFMHVSELARMGADIAIKGNTAVIKGKPKLVGAPIMATDLRASASLIIAALAAEGETVVDRIYHLDRGYEQMERKLALLGADIERISGK